MPAGQKYGNSLSGPMRTLATGTLALGLEQDLPGGEVS